MKLVADPRNPAQYLAACGLFELAANRDQDLTSHWADDGLIIDALTEVAFRQVVSDFASSKLTADETWTGEDTVQPYVICNPNAGIHIYMDWWERRDGRSNSFWKCFGGRQKSTDVAKLLIACNVLADQGSPEDLFLLSQPLTSRLGFDPRSAWNSIDTGFSPNDLGAALKAVPTFVFTELLAAIALQRWPFRPARHSCRYDMWTQPVPLSIARIHAVLDRNSTLEFFRVKRGQGISCFTYSRPYRATKENRS